VASAPHSDFQSMSTGEVDGVPDIIGVSTPCNQGGSSLRVGVPKIDASRYLITRVRWKNEATLQLCTEFLESVRINLASVSGSDLTEGSRQPQRSSCGERLLDELATALTGVKIHVFVSRILYESVLNYSSIWSFSGVRTGYLPAFRTLVNYVLRNCSPTRRFAVKSSPML